MVVERAIWRAVQRAVQAMAGKMPAMTPAQTEAEDDASSAIHQPRLWRDHGWTARVVKNNDDEGWAVEMIKHGEPEPALIGPWTMGRDKKNPKPLDTNAFNTLVKTAHEVVRRHEQSMAALHRKSVYVEADAGRIEVTLEVVPDEDDAHALLAAADADGQPLAQVRVAADFKLNSRSAAAWIEAGFRRPG